MAARLLELPGRLEAVRSFGERLMAYRWNRPAYSLSYANPSPAGDRAWHDGEGAAVAAGRAGCLDEAGRDDEIEEMTGRLRDDGGYTISVIEHDMRVVELERHRSLIVH